MNVVVLNTGVGVGTDPLFSGGLLDVNVLSRQPRDSSDVVDLTVGGNEGIVGSSAACSDNGDRVDVSVLTSECTDNSDLVDVRVLDAEYQSVGDTVRIGI